MKPFRAIGVRFFDPPRPERSQTEAEDLSTFTNREAALAPDAVAVAPPKPLWTPLAGPVPGRLIRGTLPEDPYAKFILRLPRDWNGKVVVAAAPGLISAAGNDLYWSDFCLSRGYAFGSTDKGISMTAGAECGYVPITPETGIARWLGRLQGLAELARRECRDRYGEPARRLYAAGLSNGGYLARRAAESEAEFCDGAVDVSGVFWSAEGENLLTQLPRALRAFSSGGADRGVLSEIGLPSGEQWAALAAQYRHGVWDTVLAYFIGDFDPDYRGETADYDLDSRPAAVRERIGAVANTGRLVRPLISVYGTADPLLAPRYHALGYDELVRAQGRSGLHRVRPVADGSHNDFDKTVFKSVEALMPAAHAALEELDAWADTPRTPAAGRGA